MDSSSKWLPLSHLGKVSRPPKIMTPQEMLAPLPKPTLLDSPFETDDTKTNSSNNISTATTITNSSSLPPTVTVSPSTGSATLPPVRTEKEQVPVVPSPPPSYVEHAVQKSDTLLGLSLKYGISISEIKQINDLATDNIAYLKYLKIPIGNHRQPLPDKTHLPDTRRTLVRKFTNTYKLSEKEAKYYLDLVDYDYNSAVKEYEQDMQFEKQHQPEIQKVLQPILGSSSLQNATTRTTSRHGSGEGTTNPPTLLSKLSSFLPSSSSSSSFPTIPTNPARNIPSSYATSPQEIEPLTNLPTPRWKSKYTKQDDEDDNEREDNPPLGTNKIITMENTNNNHSNSNNGVVTLRKRK